MRVGQRRRIHKTISTDVRTYEVCPMLRTPARRRRDSSAPGRGIDVMASNGKISVDKLCQAAD
jgi:hypothetical protein